MYSIITVEKNACLNYYTTIIIPVISFHAASNPLASSPTSVSVTCFRNAACTITVSGSGLTVGSDQIRLYSRSWTCSNPNPLLQWPSSSSTYTSSAGPNSNSEVFTIPAADLTSSSNTFAVVCLKSSGSSTFSTAAAYVQYYAGEPPGCFR